MKEILLGRIKKGVSEDFKIIAYEILGYLMCTLGVILIFMILSKIPYTTEFDLFLLILLVKFIFIGTLFTESSRVKRKKDKF